MCHQQRVVASKHMGPAVPLSHIRTSVLYPLQVLWGIIHQKESQTNRLARKPICLLVRLKAGHGGGTVAQTVAPTTFRLDAHGGHRFKSGPMSFLLSTPHLFSLSFPVPLFTDLLIKGLKSPKTNNIFLKKQDITRLKWSEIGE